MGYDSSMTIKKGMIRDITNSLIFLGYKEVNNKNNLIPCIKRFFFYEDDDYKYFEGVSFAIYKIDNDYILAGRNSYSASDFDVIKHNETLKYLSNKHNLKFSSDYGDSKLLPVSKNPKKGLVNGIYYPYWEVSNQLNMLNYFCDSIPKQTTQEKDMQKMFGSIFQREIYGSNICIIHLVTIMEIYYKNTFIAIIKLTLSESEIKKKFPLIPYFKRKYNNGEISIYHAAANSYSFQNIENICKSFKKLNIDLEYLYKSKKGCYEKIDAIFKHRHENVHLLTIDEKYNYDKFIVDSLVVEKIIKLTYRYLCKVYKIDNQE